MKSTKQQSIGTGESNTNTAVWPEASPRVDGSDSASGEIRTTARDYPNPVDYRRPYESMKRLAEALALGFDCNRTRHAYYRQMRLVHEHFGCDPEGITEEQLRYAKRRGAAEPSPLCLSPSAPSAPARDVFRGGVDSPPTPGHEGSPTNPGWSR